MSVFFCTKYSSVPFLPNYPSACKPN